MPTVGLPRRPASRGMTAGILLACALFNWPLFIEAGWALTAWGASTALGSTPAVMAAVVGATLVLRSQSWWAAAVATPPWAPTPVEDFEALLELGAALLVLLLDAGERIVA